MPTGYVMKQKERSQSLMSIASAKPINIWKQYHVSEEETKKMLKKISNIYHTMVGTANDIADSALRDAIRLMKQQHPERIKQKVKYHMNLALKESTMVCKALNDDQIPGTEEYDLFLDYLDNANERMKGDLQKLFYALKNNLDKLKHQESTYRATLEKAWYLQIVAYQVLLVFTKYLKTIKGVRILSDFKDVNMYRAFVHWDKVLQMTDKHMPNYPNDKMPKLAAEIIASNIVKYDLINEDLCKAMELHPDFMEEQQK